MMESWWLIFLAGWMGGTLCMSILQTNCQQKEEVTIASLCPGGWPEQHPCCLGHEEIMKRGLCKEEMNGWRKCILTWYEYTAPDAAGLEHNFVLSGDKEKP